MGDLRNWLETLTDEEYDKFIKGARQPAKRADLGRFTPLRSHAVKNIRRQKVGMTPDDIREAGPLTIEDYRAFRVAEIRAKVMSQQFLSKSDRDFWNEYFTKNPMPNLDPRAERPAWPQTLLDVASTLAERGTCPRLRAGAVVTDAKHKIIGTGYNGAPRGVAHCTEAGCTLHDGHCVRAIHAEMNALFQAGITLPGSKLFSTHRPCIVCARFILQLDIAEVYYLHSYDSDGMFGVVEAMFAEKGVKLVKWTT